MFNIINHFHGCGIRLFNFWFNWERWEKWCKKFDMMQNFPNNKTSTLNLSGKWENLNLLKFFSISKWNSDLKYETRRKFLGYCKTSSGNVERRSSQFHWKFTKFLEEEKIQSPTRSTLARSTLFFNYWTFPINPHLVNNKKNSKNFPRYFLVSWKSTRVLLQVLSMMMRVWMSLKRRGKKL